MSEDKMFDLLTSISDKQLEMAEDVAAVKQHLKDINGSVKAQKNTCIRTTTDYRKELDGIKTKLAMASGGLGAIMFLLYLLSYIGLL